MRRLMRSPRFWLAAQMVVVLVLAARGGLLTVREEPDSSSYVEASRLGPAEMLNSFRTIGYPLLLKAVARVCGDLRVMPWLHMVAYLLAVLLFDVAWRRFGASPGQACAAASGVLYTVFYYPGVNSLLTDCLSRAAAVATMGFLVWVAASAKRLIPWIGLTISLACTYHLRPAYLFLVALTPCLGFILLRIHAGWKGDRFRWFAPTLALCGISVLPYLGFCLLRLLVVGHFGLVSFAGYNLVGVAVEFVDRESAESRLPESLRPLALEILSAREARGMESAFQNGRIDLDRLEANYNANIWDVAYPVAVRMYGDDPVVVNRKLTSFSRAAIFGANRGYVRFVISNFRCGLGRVLRFSSILQALGSMAVVLFAVRVLVHPASAAEVSVGRNARNQGVMQAVLLLGLAFALGKLLLVSLLELHIDRYVYAAGLFLPSIFSLLIFEEGATIWRAVMPPGRASTGLDRRT